MLSRCCSGHDEPRTLFAQIDLFEHINVNTTVFNCLAEYFFMHTAVSRRPYDLLQAMFLNGLFDGILSGSEHMYLWL
jgi:hypothetical protein